MVSAGGETHMPNICVSRFLDIPSIFCGSLMRGLGPENFSLIVSSYDRDAASDRYLVTLKPSSIDPDALGRPASVPRYGPDLHPRLVVGGNAGPFRYLRKEWDRLLAFIAEISKAWGTRWLVSTSRRTPDYVADKIAELAKDDSIVARFIDYRTQGPGTLPEVFGKAEVILCTEDSSTMISEAVSARLPEAWRLPPTASPTRNGAIASSSCKTAGAAFCRSRTLRLMSSPADRAASREPARYACRQA